MRACSRLIILLSLALLLVRLNLAHAATNVVPASRLGQSIITIPRPDAFVPPECAARNLGLVDIVIAGAITAPNANSLILGTAAGETINGGNGNDCILGGAGNDTLRGNKGNDVLIGGPGVDRLIGAQDDGPGTTQDWCYGGGNGDDFDSSCEYIFP